MSKLEQVEYVVLFEAFVCSKAVRVDGQRGGVAKSIHLRLSLGRRIDRPTHGQRE
jgi:hypothetical protein